MLQKTWRWCLGMLYVVAVAVIWIVASFVVQSVVDSGVSPFLITYICNTLFLVYLPVVEIGRASRNLLRRKKAEEPSSVDASTDVSETLKDSETENLLDSNKIASDQMLLEVKGLQVLSDDNGHTDAVLEKLALNDQELDVKLPIIWTRRKIASASLVVCPFWFLAQYTFNLSLKYTTVTSNTILSSTSSLFTFLMSLRFLQEKFTWVKLWSILLCMTGTIVVSFSDSEEGSSVATNPIWGDLLCVASSIFYATYTTLIRKKLPDEAQGEEASTALFFGFLGLFNGLFLLPVALILHFTGVEPIHRLTALQYGLIIGKGMLDNVLSDYLWAKAVLLTSTTAATAGLTIQVPIAAIVDSVRGIHISALEYIGGLCVLVGFFGINEDATGCLSTVQEVEDNQNVVESREIVHEPP